MDGNRFANGQIADFIFGQIRDGIAIVRIIDFSDQFAAVLISSSV